MTSLQLQKCIIGFQDNHSKEINFLDDTLLVILLIKNENFRHAQNLPEQNFLHDLPDEQSLSSLQDCRLGNFDLKRLKLDDLLLGGSLQASPAESGLHLDSPQQSF